MNPRAHGTPLLPAGPRRGLRAAAALVLAVLCACQQQLGPQQVTERFWKAVRAGDAGAVRLFVTRDSRERVDPGADVLPIGGVSFGRIVIDGDRAGVATTVTVAGDEPVAVPLETRLVREDGRWKVDYAATVDAVARGGQLAGLLERLRRFNERFAGQVDRSLGELQRALPEIERELRRFEESLQRSLPELERRLEAFARELEEALKGEGERPARPPEAI